MELFKSTDSSIKNIQNYCATETESVEEEILKNQEHSDKANDQIYDSLLNPEERRTKQSVFDLYLLQI